MLICIARLFSWPKRASAFFPKFIQERTQTPFLANCIIIEVLRNFMCFKGDSNLPVKNCFLQFCLALKSSSLPYLNTFLDESYHLYLCRSVNCRSPELHFPNRFFGSWLQTCRIASGPILVPGCRLSLWLILVPDGKLR